MTERLLKMCGFSDMAYCNGDYIDQCYGSTPCNDNDLVQSCIHKHIKNKPFFFDAKETGHSDAQAYIFLTNDNELVISCRGTESRSDVLTDLKAWKNNLYDVYYHNNYCRFRNKFGVPTVHAGFYDQYNTIKFIIYHKIYNYLLTKPKNPKIVFTGHSLGGALATIGALCTAVQFSNRNDVEIKCYTYGSPRVGNSCFAKIFNKFVHESERIVNDLDPVPMIPRMTGYKHVKGLKHICNDDKGIGIFTFNKAYQKFNSFMFKIFKVIYYSKTEDHSLNEYERKLKVCNVKTFTDP